MSHLFRIGVYTCFFLSGLAALVYEIVWARYLALFLGSDGYAVMVVLATFMGGLAIGNYLMGPVADRLSRPLRWFGCLELGIGLFALAFPAYFHVCRQAYLAIAQDWAPSTALLSLKLAFSVLMILVPTVLMGATLPALVRMVAQSLAELPFRVAALYAVNSVGAVVGCWLAGFVWIPNVGLHDTVYRGATINLTIGLAAVLVSLWSRAAELVNPPPHVGRRVRADATAPPSLPMAETYLAVVGIGLTGFAVMLYEVAWTRVLALALGATTHAFSLMLITFISGIALGAMIVARWKSLPANLTTFAWLQLVMAAALLASMFFYDRLSYWFVWLANSVLRGEHTYPLFGLLQALICLGVSLVPMTCSGMMLPVVSRVATTQMSHVGRSVGLVFAVNTTGTVLGTLVTGLWLLPSLGLARTFGVGIAVNLLVGTVLLVRKRVTCRPLAWAPLPLMLVLVVVFVGWQFDGTWQHRFTMGLWRHATWREAREFYTMPRRPDDIKYYRDGTTATVSVNAFRYQGADHLVLKVNGKPDASTAEDMSTQTLLGHIPMLMRPQSQSVLVVGLGSGVTCGAVSLHPTVQRIDVVEISREVVDAARLFGDYNYRVSQDARLNIIVDDAKSYLQTAADTYDVIISEPSNPWMAGVAGLFSHQFYEACRERLAHDGLMVQWFHVYEADDSMFDVVLATFASVFPQVGVWQSSATDLMLVGSAEPREVDLTALAGRFEQPAVKADLKRIGVTRLPVFLACELIPPENGRHVPPTHVRRHSDDHPILQYMAQRSFFSRNRATRWRRFDEKLSARPRSLLARYMSTQALTEADYQAFAQWYFSRGYLDATIFRSLLSRWHEASPTSAVPYELSARLTRQSVEVQKGVAMQREALRLGRVRDLLRQSSQTRPQGLRVYARVLLDSYRHERSMFYVPPSEHLEEVLQYLSQVDPKNRRLYHLQMAELAWDRGDDQGCLRLGEMAFRHQESERARLSFPDDPTVARSVITRMIESYWRAGQPVEAWDLCRRAVEAGFIEPETGAQDPVLAMTYRKIRASISQK